MPVTQQELDSFHQFASERGVAQVACNLGHEVTGGFVQIGECSKRPLAAAPLRLTSNRDHPNWRKATQAISGTSQLMLAARLFIGHWGLVIGISPWPLASDL